MMKPSPLRRLFLLSLLLILFALGAACGDDSDLGPEGANHHSSNGGEVGGDREIGGDSDYEASDGDAAPSDPGGGADGDGETEEIEEIPPGQLTAGEWRDLDHWDFWLGLFDAPDPQDPNSVSQWTQFEERWGTYTRGRFAVVVSDGNEAPAIDAEVQLLDADGELVWIGRTDNRGRVELFNGYFGFPADGPFSIVASSGAASAEIDDIDAPDAAPFELTLNTPPVPQHAVDLMFMIDTTGSMGDELRYIQAELGDVIDRVRQEVGASMDLRVSVNFYRDHGDEYLVRPFPFTRDYDQAIADLNAQSASGGGDYPEAVDMAMENAIFEHDWSDQATARLLFLVLDAPPHENQDSIGRLHLSLEAIAAQGVRMIPLMGSGYDRSTEYLMRSFAIATGGTFTFLTDHSGIGNSHMEPTTGDYKVEFLNDLMVRIIESYSVTP